MIYETAVIYRRIGLFLFSAQDERMKVDVLNQRW